MNYPIINMVQTGQNLKRLCREKELTVRDVQKALGFASVQSIYDWFNARTLPSVDSLLALSRLLDTSMDMLLITEDSAA